ncbi:contractile injection system protein, VgrG/Pvc8 family [Pseudomonas sp. 5P_3.1_Bac2]|uniref:contractile injection system protein, VgrG/Pvc8 family n=1 Tax=Pseudomonas sp. 5P_3.1_Bac2 TaxID=2971617 RepID=UPI0021C6DEF5|nr:contractile injection system protein, VgrG/Pvc8 family [Pseudomonas sp. 5P_3.1_Bac2]MCU1717438.1 contractile injection system protein, VgrG/Pvc8 family [Pseudomonas sp. 5P_3.1_Bac2]
MSNEQDYPRPIYRLLVDGRDISQQVEARLISITLLDNRSLEADQLTIDLSDHDGLLAIPPRGAELQLWLGWSNTGLTDKGTYIVDETSHSGAPDSLSIVARSANLRSDFKVKRERSWHATTLGAVLRSIAASHGLTPVISSDLAAINIVHLDQANESDANLLARLGEQHDAVSTVKAGHLLFMRAGRGQSASGLFLAEVTLHRNDGDQHKFSQPDRNQYTGVKAYYHDLNSAQKKSAIAGDPTTVQELRHLYGSAEEAQSAANAQLQKLKRGSASLTFMLAKGRPELHPEQSFYVLGIKDSISAIKWLGKKLTHKFTATSFTTTLDLESQIIDDSVDSLAEKPTTP